MSPPNLENVFVSRLKKDSDDQSNEAKFSFTDRNDRKKDAVAIGAKDISIKFGSFQAVNSVTLDIGYGEIYGLLGANGAGKTTTIKMLCGLLTPTKRHHDLSW